MDRLSFVMLSVVFVACGEQSSHGASPARSRVNAAPATAPVERAVDPSEFCEPYHPPDTAVIFDWPALSGATKPPRPHTLWINIWATWCKPCVEELPRVARAKNDLSKLGYELVFVSADGDPDAVKQFAAAHPEIAGSLELPDANALAPWLDRLGLKDAAVLPVHLFIDADGKLRCARMAGIGEDDLAAAKRVLAEL